VLVCVQFRSVCTAMTSHCCYQTGGKRRLGNCSHQQGEHNCSHQQDEHNCPTAAALLTYGAEISYSVSTVRTVRLVSFKAADGTDVSEELAASIVRAGHP
jgi:hypothetical protein